MRRPTLYEAIADDPGLPAALLPPAWPAGEVGAALGAALRALGPAVSRYIDELRDRARSGGSAAA
jgi:DNA-binding transcriptional regulator PaaX